MSEIINITCAERKLMEQVQALTEQLELERNTVHSLSEQLESVRADAARYQQLRRGQHWSVINWIGDTLRADALDAAIDDTLKAGGAA